MDTENDDAKPLKGVQVELRSTRWLVAGLMVISGILAMFAWHFFGIFNEGLSDYFNVTKETTDWLTLCAGIGQLVGGPFAGFFFVLRPTLVKAWYIVMLVTLTFSFAMFAFVLHVGKYLVLCMLTQILVGVVCVIYFALIPLTATAWFGEREQATAVSFGWFAMMAGVLLASSVPPLLYKPDDDSQSEMHSLAIFLCCMSSISLISLIAFYIFVPNTPVNPPSYAEKKRLEAAKVREKETYHDAIRQFVKESKLLLTNRINATLVLLFCLVDSIFVSEFMLAPASTPYDSANSTTKEPNASKQSILADETSAERGYVLVAYSIGGLIGTVAMGLVVDKLKRYNPLASILGISSCCSASLALLSYLLRMQKFEYASNFLYGITTLAAYPFIQEILKQHSYPDVQESTQGLFFAIVGSIFCILLPISLRAAMDQFGDVSFYIIVASLFLLIEILLLSIKPKMNRFEYDTESANSNNNIVSYTEENKTTAMHSGDG